MVDEVEKNNIKIDIEKLKEIFGVEVIVILVSKGFGIDKLKEVIDKNFFKKGRIIFNLEKILEFEGKKFFCEIFVEVENVFSLLVFEF